MIFPSSTTPDEYREDAAVLTLDDEEFNDDFPDMLGILGWWSDGGIRVER